MSLPGPREPVQAFNFMLETAQTLARNLGVNCATKIAAS